MVSLLTPAEAGLHSPQGPATNLRKPGKIQKAKQGALRDPLGGSLVLISRVLSRVTLVITLCRVRATLLIGIHEPSSKGSEPSRGRLSPP